MALFHIPIDRITQAHLQALIDTQAPESRSIEYKRQIYGDAHSDRSEFLADISSFANSNGGDIVIGMEAAKGVPTGITPINVDVDGEKLRLEQIARDGLRPRITDLAIVSIPIQPSGGSALIIRIPRSFNTPHRVIRQGTNRFWSRSSAGKFEPDVDELRQLFLAGPQLTERIRTFRRARVDEIANGESHVPLMNERTTILHIVPLSAFGPPISLPLKDVVRDYAAFLPTGTRSATDPRINFDGVIKFAGVEQKRRAYVQLFRSGIVEAVNSDIGATEPHVIRNLEDNLTNEVQRFLLNLSQIGVMPPYAVLITLNRVYSSRLILARGRYEPWDDDLGNTFDRDQYLLDEAIFETLPQTLEETATGLRSALDQLANAAGEAACRSFNERGQYIPLSI
jgi:hypothetical protein